jgi:hypothetical protein
MARQIQLRRGTTTQTNSFTGALAEITVDTDKDVVVVHDGSTAGGHPLAKTSSLGTAAFTAATAYATAAQGTLADSAVQPNDSPTFGSVTVTGTVDGRDVAADGTKLDGVEVSADVTDTANVTAAGALMDSEVTNLAQIKAFSSSDYATAAQGTIAEGALPKSGGAMTGAITTNSTFDGVDVGARDAVLTSTTTTANAALPKAGGTLTGALLGTSATFSGDVTLNATTSIKVPVGTTGQRPSGANGMLRYNSTDAQFEGYADGAWGAIAGGGGDTQTVTTSSTTQTALASYAASTSLGIEITVIATDTVATERTITKLLVTHDGTTAVATQYGEVNTATAVASYDVDISGSNVRLLATAASANSTNFTAVATILA